jgi:hypothetical protein
VALSPTIYGNTPTRIKKTIIHSEQPSSSKDPPYPERINLSKSVTPPGYNLITELKNVCITIHLLHALKDVPIYAKMVRKFYLKKPGRKIKDPLTIHLIGEYVKLFTGHNLEKKYGPY